MTSRPKPALKYYQYISGSKLDMLSEQVPLPLRQRIAAELSVDLKIFKLSAHSERASDETRHAKLRLVETFIDENELAGTVEEPLEYFRGSMVLGMTLYDEVRGSPRDVVFWGGKAGSTRLGLAGSTYHLVGERRSNSQDKSASQMARIMPALDPELVDLTPPVEVDDSDDPAEGLRRRAVDSVSRVIRRASSFQGHKEFLAVTLLRDTNEAGQVVLLGSPIYVANAPQR